jgi:hypothetical protein
MLLVAANILRSRLVVFFAIVTFVSAINDFVDIPAQYVVGKPATIQWTSLTGYIQAFQVANKDYTDFVPDLISTSSTPLLRADPRGSSARARLITKPQV